MIRKPADSIAFIRMKFFPRFGLQGLFCAVLISLSSRAEALILQGADDESFNTSAPTGAYENSGWQYQGNYGIGLGTVISPTQFITASHLGLSTTFEYNSITYTVDTSSAVVIPGTDLMVLEVSSGTFSEYAALYDGPLTSGMELVSHGGGSARGNEVIMNGDLIGWVAGGGFGEQRWGVNQLDGEVTIGTGTYLLAGFDQSGGPNEFGLIGGDSGGGVFVYDAVDGRWELAGVNFAVSGPYRIDPMIPAQFYGAFFDTSSLFEFDGVNWITPSSSVTQSYMSSVTASVSAINAVLVPEPGSGLAVLCGMIWCLLGFRRR